MTARVLAVDVLLDVKMAGVDGIEWVAASNRTRRRKTFRLSW